MNINEKFSFENTGTSSFLVYSLAPEEKVDSIGIGMLSNNKITGVLPFSFSQLDDDRFFKYNVTSKLSLAQFFSSAVNKKRLTTVLSSIINAIITGEDYMLQQDGFLLDMNYIFVDVSTSTAFMTYIPVERGLNSEFSFKDFIRNMMYSLQFDQTENGDYVIKILSYLNSNSQFSILDFKSLIDDIVGVKKTVPKQPVHQQMQPSLQQGQPVTQMTIQPKPIQGTGVPSNNSTQQPFQAVNNSSPVINQQGTQINSIPVANQSKNKNQKNKSAVPNNIGFEIPGAIPNAAEGNVPTGKPIANNPVQQQKPIKEKKPGFFSSLFGSKKKKGNTNIAPQQGLNIPKTQNTPMNHQQVPNSGLNGDFNNANQNINSVNANINPVNSNSNPGPVIVNAASYPIGETTLLGVSGVGETTVLSPDSTKMKTDPYLIRIKTGERININKALFRLGKERTYVDYFVNNNTAISRTHADIITRDGEYFIRDNNSTNGTYVNGNRITSNQEVKIKHDDKIMLANEVFQFKLY